VFDLRPSAIIDMLHLRRPIYRQTAAYGHMGRTDIDLPWEKTDKVEELLIEGRHDAAIILRAGVVLEACVAIALADAYLINKAYR
jgi:hypothetical protein